MGRPEEIQDAKAKTFRLPSRLVSELDDIAELRGVTSSEVVRTILERNIGNFHDESCREAEERVQNMLSALDAESRKLFDTFKDESEVPVPAQIMRDQARLAQLSAAIDSYKVLKATRDKRDSHKLLSDVATQVKPPLAKLLHGLSTLVDSGELRLEITSESNVIFTVDPSVNRRSDATGAIQLFKLIDGGRLEAADHTKRGRKYLWKNS